MRSIKNSLYKLSGGHLHSIYTDSTEHAGYFTNILSISTFIQYPPITERA